MDGSIRFFATSVFKRGLGAVVALAILILVLIFGTARLAVAQGDYGRAQLLPGGVADGAGFYAASLLREGDRDGADAAARRALSASLANPRALRVLGQIRAETGRQSAAMLYGASGLWTWRDTPTQFWLLRYKLAAGDLAGALQHADSMMRRNQNGPALFSMLSRLAAASPKATEAMLLFFEAKPRWRTHFFDSGWMEAIDSKGVSAILFALTTTSAPPTDREVRAAVRNMISRNQKAEAEMVWARFHLGEKLENP